MYNIHLECAKYWNVTWQYVQSTINAQLDKMMDSVYQKPYKKLDAIQKHGSHNKNTKEATKQNPKSQS